MRTPTDNYPFRCNDGLCDACDAYAELFVIEGEPWLYMETESLKGAAPIARQSLADALAQHFIYAGTGEMIVSNADATGIQAWLANRGIALPPPAV